LAQDNAPAGKNTLVVLGEVPALGPCFQRKEEAVRKMNLLLATIAGLTNQTPVAPYQIILKRQVDGCYTLAIKSDAVTIDVLANIDELLLKRFQKVFRNLFILTCFYETAGKPECLAVTDGLGAVLYSYYDFSFFQTS